MSKPKARAEATQAKKAKTVNPPNVKEFKRTFGPVRQAQLALAALNQPQSIISPSPTKKQMRSLAAKIGLDANVMEEEWNRELADVVKLAEIRHSTAVKQSGAVHKLLKSSVPPWVGGGEVGTLAGTITRYLLETPFLIWPTPGLQMDEASIAPGNSVTKFRYSAILGQGNEQSTFFFSWENPSDYPTSISVDGYLILNGFAKAVCKGGWDVNIPYSEVSVSPVLQVFGQWDSQSLIGSDSGEGTTVWVNPAGLFYSHSVARSTNIAKGLDMRADSIAVPANGIVYIGVDTMIGYVVNGNSNEYANGSSIEVDFSFDAFNITTPGVLITKYI